MSASARDGHVASTIRLEPEREDRLHGLLLDFALGAESGKQFDIEEMRTLNEDLRQMLGEIEALRGDTARQATYIERLEAANSALTLQFAAEQLERECLVEQGTIMLGEFATWMQKVNALRGRGTPRSVARIATDNSPRFAEAGN